MLGESRRISQPPNSLIHVFCYWLCCLERRVMETTHIQSTYLLYIINLHIITFTYVKTPSLYYTWTVEYSYSVLLAMTLFVL